MAGEDMDMVLDSPHEDRGAVEFAGSSAEPGMHFGPEDGIAEEWTAVLGRENEMEVNDREGLRHRRRGWTQPR
ncbi:MAG: hypothetical protein JWM16_2315 [Verrucomicrobiales bacterium]|nr:hypothetical protein [Verrucomicrobiales bacterium]